MRRKNLKKIRIEERVETPSRYFYFFITTSGAFVSSANGARIDV